VVIKTSLRGNSLLLVASSTPKTAKIAVLDGLYYPELRLVIWHFFLCFWLKK
jgi:hypothetical protein